MQILMGIALLLVATVVAFALTPVVKRFAIRIGAVDKPNKRKVHKTLMPSLGGLAIYLAFVGTYFIFSPFLPDMQDDAVKGLLIGGSIIVLTGMLDDRFELSAKWKLLGQLIAAGVVVIGFNLQVEFVNLPFGDVLVWHGMEWVAIGVTMLWIVGVTNAINLIDGLDGLAAGVSAIATATITILALITGNITVALLSLLLLGSILGFLFFNFHPAKIFMGDTGALFLGFSLATFSVLGFKSATVVSFIIPLLILGVPLSDTFLAIVRRIIQKKPISVADKSHLHHCLQQLGFSHRNTVLVIYGIAAFFGACAILNTMLMLQNLTWLVILITLLVIVIVQLGAEAIGIVSAGKRPLWNFLRRIQVKTGQFFR